MMKPFIFLRIRLLVFVLLAFVPAVGLTLFTFADQRHHATEQAKDTALQLARTATSSYERLILQTQSVLTGLAQLPALRQPIGMDCPKILRARMDEFLYYANIGVVDIDGNLICSALPTNGRVNIADRPYFWRAVASGDFAIGEYQVGRVTGKGTINFGYPMLDARGRVGQVVYAALDLAWLNDFAANANLPPGSSVTVLDRKGTILARFPDSDAWVGKSEPEAPIVAATISGGEGTVEAAGLDGVARLYGFVPLQTGRGGSALFLSVGIPKAAALQEATRDLARNALAVTIFGTLALLAAWAGGNHFVFEPVNRLITAAERLGRGELSVRSGLPHDTGEFGRLAITFDSMAAALQSRQTQLEQAREAERQERERAERQLRHTQALRAVDQAITGSLDLRLTLAVVLDQVVGELHADAADVLLIDPHSQELFYGAGRGFRGNTIIAHRLRLGEGSAGRAVLDRRTVSIEDLQAAADFSRRHLVEEEGFVAAFMTPLVAKGQIVGVLEIFQRRPFQPTAEWLEFLETLAGQAAIAIDNAELFQRLQRANVDLTLAYDTTLEGWSRALDLRDKETEGHTQRVTDLTVRLARAMGLREEEMAHLRRGALLHDMGKMRIPDSILLKPGPLTDDEWAIMKKHPAYAFELLSPIAHLRPALEIPYDHHEKWDGTGYPRGLRGEQIPMAARIFAVADVWDALRSDRPYRPAWPQERALNYIREQAGKHFDPVVVQVFLGMVERPAQD